MLPRLFSAVMATTKDTASRHNNWRCFALSCWKGRILEGPALIGSSNKFLFNSVNMADSRVYTSAVIVRYTLNLPNDYGLLALEHMHKIDSEFANELNSDEDMSRLYKRIFQRRRTLTEVDKAKPNVKYFLQRFTQAMKLRASFCIIQEERLRGNIDWVKESEREKAIRDVRFESCSMLNTMILHQDLCGDETFNTMLKKLKTYRWNRLDVRGRNVIEDH